jgi:integrase
MPRQPSVPKYRKHKSSGQAIVTLRDGLGNRRDVLLGKFGTAASRAEYARVIGEWEAASRRLPARAAAVSGCTVNELILLYWRHVEGYYRKDGKPTSEPDTIRQALRFVRQLYGHTPAAEFGPLALKAVRDAMVKHPVTRRVRVLDPETGEVRKEDRVYRVGLSRRLINKQVGRIRQMFRWATEQELLPVSVYQSLLTVKGLRKGERGAREKPRIKPVPAAFVDAVLPHLPPLVHAMVEVHRLCGGRPQDVVQMRPLDIDMTGDIWEYRPPRYKTEHHDEEADQGRVLFLGPQAQAFLKPLLPLNVADYIFNPGRSERERNAARRGQRKTPLWGAHLRAQERKKKRRKRRAMRDHYAVAAYRRAVHRACAKAGVPPWHPNQLRHSRLTEIRKRYGLEASKACGGHRLIGTTQHYAEQDQDLAKKVMREIG